MEKKKITNGTKGSKIPTPPPVVPKKSKEKQNGKNKKLLVLIPVIIAILVVAVVVAVVLKNGDKNKGNDTTTLAPVVVTDENGVPVTDVQGEVVTVVPETEVHEYTNANGEKQTTIVYKDVTVAVPITNKDGVVVTNKDGEALTQQQVITPTFKPDGSVVVGTTAVPVTDGQGHTTVDNQGNIFTTIVEITSTPAVVEPAAIEWKKSIGGSVTDYVSSIATLADGSYITSTVTNSTDGDFAKYKELKYTTPYTVLTKYSKDGEIIWQNALGSKKGVTIITTLLALGDGGFYASGYGKNVGGVSGRGYYDGAVFKFDEKGEQLWFKTFATSTVDLFNDATLTSDGGIIAVGSVGNNDGDAKGFNKPRYESAAAIVKFSADGNIVWKDIIGGNKDSLTGVAEGTDGSIYCIGNFYSGAYFKNLGYADSCLLKYTSDGKYVASRSIAGTGNETFSGITACRDGGVAVVGKSNSSDAGATDSMFVANLAARGGYDAYLIKYNSDFNLSFARTFRGQNDDNLNCIVEKEDGSFIVAGESNSSSRDLKGVTTRGGNDIVIASFSKMGELSWARSFGGTKSDTANAICLAKDGGYLVVGRTFSTDIDMKGIAQYVGEKPVGVIVKFPE